MGRQAGMGDEFARCLFLHLGHSKKLEHSERHWKKISSRQDLAEQQRLPWVEIVHFNVRKEKNQFKPSSVRTCSFSGFTALLTPAWMQKEAFASTSDTSPVGWSHECPQLLLKSMGVKGVQHFPGSGHVSLKNNSPTLNIIKETNAH